jgi:hypothetical protein
MGWLWSLLLSLALPKLLEWLKNLLLNGKKVAGRDLEKLDETLWYCQQIAEYAPKLGAKAVPPSVGAPVGGWLENLLLRYVREHGKEIGLQVVRELVLPWLRKQAADSQNKLDDYAVKQLERVVNDPEFVALLEGIA